MFKNLTKLKVNQEYRRGEAAYRKSVYTEAVYWFIKAAVQGHVDAQNMLGECCYWGHGLPKDYAKAVYWFSIASMQGHAEAQVKLGGCYENGYGVSKDYKQAVYWYEKAAVQGLEKAQYELGLCYGRGRGVDKDYEKAKYWLEKAAAQNDFFGDAKQAIYNLELERFVRKTGRIFGYTLSNKDDFTLL